VSQLCHLFTKSLLAGARFTIITGSFLVVTFAKELMFYLLFVCLSVSIFT